MPGKKTKPIEPDAGNNQPSSQRVQKRAAATPPAAPNSRINSAMNWLTMILIIVGIVGIILLTYLAYNRYGDLTSTPAAPPAPTATAPAKQSEAAPGTTPGANSSPNAGQTPTGTNPSTSTTPQSGGTVQGCTNSPNIPCVKAQGQKAGFAPFEVDSQIVGGPAEQWWPLQRADGTFVPNSFKMVGMRQSDKNLPGYEIRIPENMIMDVWLDGPTFTNRKTAVRIYGPADISAEYRGAEATLYTRPADFVGSMAGTWARLNDQYACGDFVKVGSVPPTITSPHDCHLAK